MVENARCLLGAGLGEGLISACAAGEGPRAGWGRQDGEPKASRGSGAERKLMGRSVQGTLVKVCACVCGAQSRALRNVPRSSRTSKRCPHVFYVIEC